MALIIPNCIIYWWILLSDRNNMVYETYLTRIQKSTRRLYRRRTSLSIFIVVITIMWAKKLSINCLQNLEHRKSPVFSNIIHYTSIKISFFKLSAINKINQMTWHYIIESSVFILFTEAFNRNWFLETTLILPSTTRLCLLR